MSIGTQVLNNQGMFTGFSDTNTPDPYGPDGCWDGDCLVAHASRWDHGKLTDLGVVDAGPNSETNWISKNGIIAGDSQNGLLDPFGGWEIRGVVWKGNHTSEVGTLDGGYDSLARAVNSAGQVVGLSTTLVPDDNAMIMSFGLPFPFQTRAFRWKNGVLRDLGTLGGSDAMALGINERGQIIGNSYMNSDPSPACGTPTTGGFLWQRGKMTNLGSLGGTCTNVSAINERGQVTGYSFLRGDELFHPFRWHQGNLEDLGTLGSSGIGNTLNEAGDVVGWETPLGNDNVIHATLWSHNRIFDLGALGSDECSIANGVNSRREVVGLSGNCNFDDPTLRAFLWEPGGRMLDLNTLISPDLGLDLRNVSAINERGEMAVVAFFPNGDHRPVLLVPCGEHDWTDDECREASTRDVAPARQSFTAKQLDGNSARTSLKRVLAPWYRSRHIAPAK